MTVIDPLISLECVAAALALYRAHRGDRPVTAVIYTHAHLDHFGGVLGVVDADTAIPIIAPEHFMEHAVSENVYAGIAMLRRGMYYGGDGFHPRTRGHHRHGVGGRADLNGMSGCQPQREGDLSAPSGLATTATPHTCGSTHPKPPGNATPASPVALPNASCSRCGAS